jgi:hypothetical protein
MIGTPLLLSPMFFDNPSLIPLFNRLKMLDSVTKNVYFPLNFASKLVQRFPSLIDIELQVFSLDICVPLVDILLGGLVNLIHLKIYYTQDTLLDDPCSRDYVIEKRRQTFGINLIDENKVTIKNNGEVLEIWLS